MRVYLDCREAAANYARRGWSVIPLKGKIPTGPWAEYQERRMALEEIERRQWPGVGVVTGKISTIVVLDADSEEAIEELKRRGHPVTPTSRTARGIHLFFRHPGCELPTQVGLGGGLDLKGDGGYVAAPPSRHPLGTNYEWIISPEEAEPTELPGWVMDEIRLRGTRRTSAADLGEAIPNGSRNETLTSIAGTLRRRGLRETAIYAALLGINAQTCKPPLPETEVAKIAKSVSRYAAPKADYTEEIHSFNLRVGAINESILRFKTAKEIIEETPEEVPWCVRPWVAKGSITEISGRIKAAGKTTFCLHIAAKVLDGKPFMDQPTEQTGVVFLTEQPPSSFREALAKAELVEREDLHILFWHDATGIPWPDVVRAAIAKCEEENAGLFFVDTLSVFARLRGDAENSAGAAQEVMAPLKKAAATGLAVVYTRHERKSGGAVGESGRGSSAFAGDADQLLSLKLPESKTRDTVRVLESLGRFEETPKKLMIELTGDGYRSLGDSGAFTEKEAMEAIVNVLPAALEHAWSTDRIVDELAEQRIKRSAVTGGLNKLTEVGTIARQGKGRKGDPFTYYKPTPGENSFIYCANPIGQSNENESGDSDSDLPPDYDELVRQGTDELSRCTGKASCLCDKCLPM